MTYTEFYAAIDATVAEIAENESYEYVGVRFEDKVREISDVCECSKHNPDREDERDFPVYGSEEYEDLPELNGASA